MSRKRSFCLLYVKIKIVEHWTRKTFKCAGFGWSSNSCEFVWLGNVNDIRFLQSESRENSIEFTCLWICQGESSAIEMWLWCFCILTLRNNCDFSKMTSQKMTYRVLLAIYDGSWFALTKTRVIWLRWLPAVVQVTLIQLWRVGVRIHYCELN